MSSINIKKVTLTEQEQITLLLNMRTHLEFLREEIHNIRQDIKKLYEHFNT